MLCCEKGEREIYIEKVFIVVKLYCAEVHVHVFLYFMKFMFPPIYITPCARSY